MSRLSLVAAVAGAGVLLVQPAASATGSWPVPGPRGTTSEARALDLLRAAAVAARSRTYAGTEYVSTWRDGSASSSIAEIRHSPATGAVITVRRTAGQPDGEDAVTVASELDLRLLRLLADHFVLSVAGRASCTGREAVVVEARRPGADAVAGRFWLDRASGLALRREVFDRSGTLVRSSVFAELTLAPAAGAELAVPVHLEDPSRLAPDELERFRREGWQVPLSLPGDLEFFDARVRTRSGQPVLHLSYSDGLSTLALFAQRGSLGTQPMSGYAQESVAQAPVWVRTASPERVVWSGGGRVWTLLSDAPADAVHAAVSALPHDRAHHDGLLSRLGRGLKRLASWLNPFS